MAIGQRLAGAGMALALAGYAAGSAWLMAAAPRGAWTVAALFGPLLAALLLDALRRRHARGVAALLGMGGVLAMVVLLGGVREMTVLYVLQHAAVHAALAWSFAVTLRPGATPLITGLAERIHTRFTPEMRAYTGWLTRAWVVFFLAMIGVSLLVYALAPWSWWSVWCTLVTPLAAMAFFVGEYVVRRWRHPEFEPASLAAAVNAYRNGARRRSVGTAP